MSAWSNYNQWAEAMDIGALDLLERLWEGEKPPPEFDVELFLDRCELAERRHWMRAIERYGPRREYFFLLASLVWNRSVIRAACGAPRKGLIAITASHVSALLAYAGLVLLWLRYHMPYADTVISLRPMAWVLEAL